MCDFSELSRLIQNSQGRLLRYAEHLLHNAASAQDAVQNAYVRYILFVRKSGGVFRAGNLEAWLFRTVRNLCLDQIKSASFRLETSWDESDFDGISSWKNSVGEEFSESPEQKLRRKEDLLEMRRLIKTLSGQEQEVLALKFEEEKSYAEIAEIMHISSGYVGYLLHQAVMKLKSAGKARYSENNKSRSGTNEL